MAIAKSNPALYDEDKQITVDELQRAADELQKTADSVASAAFESLWPLVIEATKLSKALRDKGIKVIAVYVVSGVNV